MKSKYKIRSADILSVLAAVILITALSGAALSANQSDSETQQLYTCGMHPEIISTEPGFCPICNMRLTPKKDGSTVAGSVAIDPVTRQNMGLRTVTVDYNSLAREIRASGRITIPETNIFSVNLKVAGWVNRLFINEIGERVSKGQPLMEIYSPDLVAAQQEYLVALRTTVDTSSDAKPSHSMTTFLEMSYNRLRNWDITEDQIDSLRRDGVVRQNMLIRAPADGYVLFKNIESGERITPGQELFRIAGLSEVWATAYVYEPDLPFVKLNQKARVVISSLPDREFSSRIIYVSPVLNKHQQAEIRLELSNPRLDLKPDMYAEVTVNAELSGLSLTIPREAVINSGTRQLVFVTSGENQYHAREVTTGAVGADDMIEILDGLRQGEQVVVSGQFLLDSESRLSEAISIGGHHHQSESGDDEKSTIPDRKIKSASHNDHQTHETPMSDPYNIHTCPMPEHYHVLNYGPGRCSECGMKLVSLSETENEKVYVCPMPQCGMVASKPGKCSVCGMNLVKYHPEADND